MTAVDPREAGSGYAPLPPDRPAAQLEEEVLARWEEEGLFARTLAATEGAPPFVFYEGPPTANGRPGIHHVFARTVKDLFCRHRAMRGFHVARKAGWDTHGLPVEIEVEKQLGISGKPQIEELGVERFNQLCRENVWKYRAEWERLSARIGFWLDYSDPYVTYSNDYVESVWWALKTLFDRGLLYQGHKILPYCARCGTTLSSHEVAQGYQDVEDPSVYVALDLLEPSTLHAPRSLSSHEPAYTERGAESGEGAPSRRRRILVWTTTPWTLPANVALAVNPALEYLELRKKSGAEWTIILAADAAKRVLGDDYESRWDAVARMWGSDLAGQRYRRPLDWVEYPAEGQHEIIVAEEFVTATDGTGVVHMAPAFGADDYAAGKRHGLAFVQPVDGRGEFPAGTPVVGGLFVKKADPLIVGELRRRDVLWKAGTETHSYPHCWRCGTPLLQYARTSWFVRTTAFKDEMLRRNAAVNWNPPETGEGRFGQWLENNIDWAVSRDRYWGTPLPVWLCDADPAHAEAVGSYAELAERSGTAPSAGFDPHKPYIDRYTWPCRKCEQSRESGVGNRESRTSRSPHSPPPTPGSGAGTMRRVPEVIDAWFDSGSMPFAQWHYPFENRELVARAYPADFIAEGVDQTRGWFYSLLAIATGLGDALPNNEGPARGARGAGRGGQSVGGVADQSRPAPHAPHTAPYRAVVVNDLVLDAEGRKMSKTRGNAVDPWAVIGKYGVDAVRLFLISSSQVWVPKRFDEGAIGKITGGFLNAFRNVYSGIFALYASFGWAPSDRDPAPADRPAIDRWVLSRLAAVERECDRLLGVYDATLAARLVMDFVDEDVSKWYVRQSRQRFYDVDGDDNRAAFATLHEVLTVTCRLLAPFAPFVSDWMHRQLTGESVHLAPFVRDRTEGAVDVPLEAAMGAVRTLATLGRAAREDAGVKVRQPLSRMVCVVPYGSDYSVDELLPLLRAELNVKEVEFASSADSLVTLEAKPNFRALGKKFGKDTKLAAEAVTRLTSEHLLAFERGEALGVSVGSETHLLDADDVTIVRRASGDLLVKEGGGFFAAIDPTVTPALRREGIARELVSRVQKLRRDARLQVSDRIILAVWGNDEVAEAARAFHGWIADEVLATEVRIGGRAGDGVDVGSYHATQTVDLDGLTVSVALTRES